MANTITATMASEVLGLSRMRVNQLINEGKLPAQRAGKYWLLDEDAVMLMAAERNGYVYHDGCLYMLLGEAMPDDAGGYVADALRKGDERDEDGYVPLYRATWAAPDDGDVDAIDWAMPDDVEQYDYVDMSVPSPDDQIWEDARRLSRWGKYPATYSANVRRVTSLPNALLAKLDARDIAALVDAFRDAYHDGDEAGRSRNGKEPR